MIRVELLINYLTMLLLVVIQSYYYFNVSPSTRLRMPIAVATTSFSMILTPMFMVVGGAGTPYIQLFFIVYQMLVFFFSMWEYRLIKVS